MWLLAELFEQLPEVGDIPKPKLVFFFDEAHLLFDEATEAFLDSVVQTVRLIRSKGVGVFFVTQTPKDIPGDVLAQLGNRVQHALRAFTPQDAKALKATVSTFPTSELYDLEELLTQLGTGEAAVTILSESGVPTPVVQTKLRGPLARMAPADDVDGAAKSSPLYAKYGTRVDRESARELLAARIEQREPEPVKEPVLPRKEPARKSESGDPLTDFLTSRQGRRFSARSFAGCSGCSRSGSEAGRAKARANLGSWRIPRPLCPEGRARPRRATGRQGQEDLLSAIVVVLGLALFNLFGQRPATTTAEADAATLEVYSPERVRGGLFFEARFTIEARREVEEATLVLDSGWAEGITINTVEPSPLGSCKPRREARLRARADPGRPQARLLPPAPGQPDERRASLAGRAALRRRRAAGHHRPHHHRVPLMDIVIRALVMFLFVWLVTRAVGRRELSTLEPFDLILLIVLGDLIQQGVTQNDFSVTGAILAGGTFAAMTVLFSWLAFRFPRMQPILEGDGRARRARQDHRPQPARQPDHPRGARRAGSAPADRPHRGRRVGRAGDERPDQLHPEERFLDSPRACVPDRSRRRGAGHACRRNRRRRELLRAARAGEVENRPRVRQKADGGAFAVMSAVDSELRFAGVKSYAWLPSGTPFVVCLFDLDRGELAAVIEADKLGQLRTGARAPSRRST